MVEVIDLEGIEIYANHGCYDEEQRVGSMYRVDVRLEVECSLPAKSDNIHDALNYVEVYNIVSEEMAINSHLLENVVMRICEHIRTAFTDKGLLSGVVKVSKLAPPVGGAMDKVSVTMKLAL